jgi:hypothetical protein
MNVEVGKTTVDSEIRACAGFLQKEPPNTVGLYVCVNTIYFKHNCIRILIYVALR